MITVVKASGETQPFSEEKLKKSLHRAKVSPDVASQVIQIVKAKLKDGMTTKEIYDLAYATLRAKQRSFASRYSLKHAIMEMGPSGHPFELYVSELMKTKGYSVKVGQSVPGLCVVHEIDVVAEKGEEHIMVECKFHNQSGIKSDVKISLYVQARFEDVKKKWEQAPGHTQKFHQPWLVTNMELTSDAIRYAECVGMKAIGWNYPAIGSLREWVESSKLHPVTCLTSLSNSQKKYLIENNIILCRSLYEDDGLLKRIGLNEEQKAVLSAELKYLCV